MSRSSYFSTYQQRREHFSDGIIRYTPITQRSQHHLYFTGAEIPVDVPEHVRKKILKSEWDNYITAEYHRIMMEEAKEGMMSELHVIEIGTQVVDDKGDLADTANIRPATDEEIKAGHPKCVSCRHWRESHHPAVDRTCLNTQSIMWCKRSEPSYYCPHHTPKDTP
jgi:hypothetical protein